MNDLSKMTAPLDTDRTDCLHDPNNLTDPDLAQVGAVDDNPPPSGFEIRDDGIYYQFETKEGERKWSWLCSPIRVLALPRGADGKGWGRLLEIVDPDGNRHRWAAPAELFAGDGAELRRECLRLGLSLDHGNAARTKFSQLLQQWMPKERATTTERLGWTDESCVTFVTGGGRIIGETGVVYQSEHAPGAAAEMRAAGKLDEWRCTVGEACIGNPIMVLAVSLAFAGALFEPIQREGGGLHLRGRSSRGKSTVLRVAVSVWGAPNFLQSWRATSNGLEGVAAARNGSLIALDEMGEITAHEAGNTAYMLANGQAKARATRTGAARPATRWRTAILSSGEISLADKMAEAGQRARAGQEVRLLDVQADEQTFGAFDNLHGQDEPAAFADHVGRMAARDYGTAGPAFVERLVADLDDALADIRRAAEAFKVEAADALDLPGEGQTRRAFDRFSLIAAAGEMATTWGITGWPKGEANRAALAGLRLWIAGRGGAGPAEDREAVDRTRAFIVANGDARFERLDDTATIGGPRVHNRAGWRDGMLYYIAADTWAKEVHAGADPTQAARAVRAAGFLETDSDGKHLTRKTPSSVAGRPRCYCVKTDIMGGGKD
jgi:putative DNA primase/helicase